MPTQKVFKGFIAMIYLSIVFKHDGSLSFKSHGSNDDKKGRKEEKCKTPHNKTIVIPAGGCVGVCERAGIYFVVDSELFSLSIPRSSSSASS